MLDKTVSFWAICSNGVNAPFFVVDNRVLIYDSAWFGILWWSNAWWGQNRLSLLRDYWWQFFKTVVYITFIGGLLLVSLLAVDLSNFIQSNNSKPAVGRRSLSLCITITLALSFSQNLASQRPFSLFFVAQQLNKDMWPWNKFIAVWSVKLITQMVDMLWIVFFSGITMVMLYFEFSECESGNHLGRWQFTQSSMLGNHKLGACFLSTLLTNILTETPMTLMRTTMSWETHSHEQKLVVSSLPNVIG